MGGHLKEPRQPVEEEAGFCNGGSLSPRGSLWTCLIHQAGHPHSLSSVFVFGLITELTALAMCLELSLVGTAPWTSDQGPLQVRAVAAAQLHARVPCAPRTFLSATAGPGV